MYAAELCPRPCLVHADFSPGCAGRKSCSWRQLSRRASITHNQAAGTAWHWRISTREPHSSLHQHSILLSGIVHSHTLFASNSTTFDTHWHWHWNTIYLIAAEGWGLNERSSSPGWCERRCALHKSAPQGMLHFNTKPRFVFCKWPSIMEPLRSGGSKLRPLASTGTKAPCWRARSLVSTPGGPLSTGTATP